MGKFKVKNEVKGEWYTEKQLNEMGMVLKRGAKGVTMYTNGFYQYAADYYTLKQARKDEGKAKAIISNNRKQQRKAQERGKGKRNENIGGADGRSRDVAHCAPVAGARQNTR
jgi:hypothetical protein